MAWENIARDEKQQNLGKIVNLILRLESSTGFCCQHGQCTAIKNPLFYRRDASKLGVKKSEISAILRANGAKVSASVTSKYIQETKRKLLHVYGFDMIECNSKDAVADVALSQDALPQNKPDMFLLINALRRQPPRPRGEGGAGAADDDSEDCPVAATSRLLATPLSTGPAPVPVDFHLAMIVMSVIALERSPTTRARTHPHARLHIHTHLHTQTQAHPPHKPPRPPGSNHRGRAPGGNSQAARTRSGPRPSDPRRMKRLSGPPGREREEKERKEERGERREGERER